MLGSSLRVEVYRLMQFCLRDVLESEMSAADADRLFFAAGKLAGAQFFENMGLKKCGALDEMLSALQKLFKDLGVGILRVERADAKTGDMTLTVSEDADCSGLPDMKTQICVYDEGFITGILESHSGKKYEVREIDCWCSGERTCRFTAKRK
jgi:predicted hydrocarbon binding protein